MEEKEPDNEYGYSYDRGRLVCWKTSTLFAGFDETAGLEEEQEEDAEER